MSCLVGARHRTSFERITQDGAVGVQLDAGQLALLLDGISIEHAKRRRRFKAA